MLNVLRIKKENGKQQEIKPANSGPKILVSYTCYSVTDNLIPAIRV